MKKQEVNKNRMVEFNKTADGAYYFLKLFDEEDIKSTVNIYKESLNMNNSWDRQKLAGVMEYLSQLYNRANIINKIESDITERLFNKIKKQHNENSYETNE